MSCRATILLVLGCGLSLASAAPGLSPELQPRSSKKFFGKDYPTDLSPASGEHFKFDHPYPAVQDTSDYDRDFVKDENSDGGKWQAQLNYDTLRQKISQADKKLAALKKKLSTETSEMEDAQKTWQVAHGKAETAQKATDVAKQVEGGANRTVKSLEDQVTSSGGVVEKEMGDLEKCKKALAEAKEKLKEMLKKQAELQKENQAAKEEAEAAARKAEAESKKKAETAAKAAEQAQKEAATINEKKAAEVARKLQVKKDVIAREIADMKDKETVWQKKIKEEKTEYSTASTDYDRLMKEVKETEAAVKKAAENLKKYRRAPHVDDNGGVYNVPKSFATPTRLSAVAMSALLAIQLW